MNFFGFFFSKFLAGKSLGTASQSADILADGFWDHPRAADCMFSDLAPFISRQNSAGRAGKCFSLALSQAELALGKPLSSA